MELRRHNAYLTAIKGGGFTKAYGQAAGAAPDLWTGEAEIFVDEELVTSTSGDRLDELKRAKALVPSNLDVEVASGDTIVFTQDGVIRERRVRNVRKRPELGVWRLYLYDE